MMTYTVKVEKSGRILIPAEVRRQMEIKEGETTVILSVDETGIRVNTQKQALERVRAEVRKYVPAGSDIVGEFLAEKRAEVARENGE
jgi:AbrB family transcriptional regulator, stage V sporulation protein T